MNWTIDKVCSLTTNPTLLNALHACREGHPLNRSATRPWFNAYFLAAQQNYFKRLPSDAIDWLLKQSLKEESA